MDDDIDTDTSREQTIKQFVLWWRGGGENIFHNRQSVIDIATFYEPHNNIGDPPDKDGNDGGFSLPNL